MAFYNGRTSCFFLEPELSSQIFVLDQENAYKQTDKKCLALIWFICLMAYGYLMLKHDLFANAQL